MSTLADTTTDPPLASSLGEALARVQARLPHIAKGKTAKVVSQKASYSYKYADLADVASAILPLLGAEGLCWITLPTMTPGPVPFVLSYELRHASSGESVSGVYPLPDPTQRSPQEIGSAMTYARRYTLCCVTGVVPDEDEDGQISSASGPAAGRQTERPAQERQQRAQEQDRAAEQPPAPPVQTVAVEPDQVELERLTARMHAAWLDLDLDELGTLFRDTQAASVPAETQLPHPVTGELSTVQSLFKEIGREIKAGRKPPGDPEPQALQQESITDVQERVRAARGAVPPDEDPWAGPTSDLDPPAPPTGRTQAEAALKAAQERASATRKVSA